jgi:ATP-binding cassette, subfamily A (ABC1), member 3
MTSTRLGIVGDPSVTSAFSGHLAEWYPGLPAPSVAALDCALASLDSDTNNVYNLAFPAFDGFTLTFPDEAALEAYVASPGYGEGDSTPAVFMAVVFDQVGGRGKAGGQWSYKIRANASVIPDTHLMTDDLQRGASVSNIRSYLAGNTSQWATGLPHPLDNRIPGFVPLQLAVDRFILNTTNGNSTASLIDVGMFAATWNCSGTLNSGVGPDLDAVASFLRSHVLLPQHVRIAPFPTSTFMSDDFYSFVESVFALVFVMSFFFPSFFLIRGLVEEKETKLREGMKMMGMSDVAIIAAWYATYAIIFACIAAAVCISLKLTMFGNSDAGLVFLFFWLFGLTATSLCFLISTLFSKAKLASVVGAVLFIAAFFPYFSVSDPLKSTAIKTAASICSPVAFGLALDLIATLESNDAGIGWGNVAETYSNFSFARALAMMVADIVLYTVLGWYFTHVLPQDYGVPLPWYFPVTRAYWIPEGDEDGGLVAAIARAAGLVPKAAEGGGDGASAGLLGGDVQSGEDWECATGEQVEPPGPALFDLGKANRGVFVRGLRKEFNTPDGVKVAVAGVDLDMFEGQIFALLGHNGAGKTTTISMLTGLLPMSSGGASVYGRSLSKQMKAIRSNMGVCPQHDVLWADLTVEEHLTFFAGLKGVPKEKVPGAVSEVVRDVGLTEKFRTLSKDLSGGMKRKLSVAIALIGGSKVVFLDEPTSGMDPYSRRSTWQVLQNAREGRVMVLTTHFMDEADLLGDRIGIMAGGKIRCCGSSMFLKREFGVGYNLTIAKAPQRCDEKGIEAVITSRVPGALALSNVGAELAFQMPLGASAVFPALFAALEAQSATLGVDTYGVSVTTLEEVFIKVAEAGEGAAAHEEEERERERVRAEAGQLGATAEKLPAGTSGGSRGGSAADAFERPTGSLFWRHFRALLIKRWRFAKRDKRAIIFNLLIPIAALSAGLALLHQVSMATWPSFAVGMSAFNPALPKVPAAGGGPAQVAPNFIAYASTPASVALTVSIMSSGAAPGASYAGVGAALGASFVPVSNLPAQYPFAGYPLEGTTPDCLGIVYEDGLPTLATATADEFLALPDAFAMSRWLLDHRNGSEDGGTAPVEGGASRYVAFTVAELAVSADGTSATASYTALVNTTSFHGAPTALAMLNSGLFNWLSGNTQGSSITVVNAPLPFTQRQAQVVSSITSFISVLFVVIAFSFIPASFAVFVVRERETGAKHQQLISGVSIPAYWLSTYTWDMLNYALPCLAAVILVVAFDIKELLGDSLPATVLLFVSYGFSVAPFTYVLSYLFKSHSTAQTMVLVLNLGCLLLLLAAYIMHLIPSTCDTDAALRYVFRLIPGYALGNGLMQLSVLAELPFLENDCGRMPWYVAVEQKFTPWSLEAAGWSLLYMGVESVVYFILAIAIDVGLSYPWIRARLFPDKDRPEKPFDDDSDVTAEAERVRRGQTKGDVVVINRLRKVYGGAKPAVRGLSFGLPPGDCFGFLGINGAGKTTTMKILTGDIVPTGGTATLSGYDILTEQTEVRRLVGYCPQFDALLDLLTVEEHLELYADIKGVPREHFKAVVAEKIHELDLDQYRNKLAGSLSGGNKRKTSVALAMIGNPLLLFLDEPSTGMDPVARRFMWRVIARISSERKKCSIVLTTHSMEEAEALCTRIGIMVGGRLRCLGSTQHLKSKFGNGYLAVFKVAPPTEDRVDRTLAMLRPFLEVASADGGLAGAADGVDEVGAAAAAAAAAAALPAVRRPDGRVDPYAGLRMPARNVMAACEALGDKQRSRMLSPSSTGWALAATLAVEGSVEARLFADWWAGESLGASLHHFVNTTFPGAELLERHGEFFRYKLPATGTTRLSAIFGSIEANKAALSIAEYSLSQMSLESIFNALAAMQEEERGVARGMGAQGPAEGGDGAAGAGGASAAISFPAPSAGTGRGVNEGSMDSVLSSGQLTPPKSSNILGMFAAMRARKEASSPGIMLHDK